MNITLKIRGASWALALLIMNIRAMQLPGGFNVGDMVRLRSGQQFDAVFMRKGSVGKVEGAGQMRGIFGAGSPIILSFEGKQHMDEHGDPYAYTVYAHEIELDDPAPPVQAVVQVLAPAEAPTAATKPKAEFLDGHEMKPETKKQVTRLTNEIEAIQQLIVANCLVAGELEDANKLKLEKLAKELNSKLAPLKKKREELREKKTKLQRELDDFKQRYYKKDVTKPKIIQVDNASVDSFASSNAEDNLPTHVDIIGLPEKLEMMKMPSLTDFKSSGAVAPQDEIALRAALAKTRPALLPGDTPAFPDDKDLDALKMTRLDLGKEETNRFPDHLLAQRNASDLGAEAQKRKAATE